MWLILTVDMILNHFYNTIKKSFDIQEYKFFEYDNSLINIQLIEWKAK